MYVHYRLKIERQQDENKNLDGKEDDADHEGVAFPISFSALPLVDWETCDYVSFMITVPSYQAVVKMPTLTEVTRKARSYT